MPQRTNTLAVLVSLVLLVLGVHGAEAVTATWTGTNSGLWADGGNWVGGTAPVGGEDLVFPAGAMNLTNTNNLPDGTAFSSIAIQDQYTITGNAVVLGAGGLTEAGTGIITYGLATTLAADQAWTIGIEQDFVISGAVHLNGHTLTLEMAGTAHLSGNIDGAGAIIKNGFNGLSLSGANSYTGPTTINQGAVLLDSATGLGFGDGTMANGTTVNNDAIIRVTVAAVGNEALTLNQTPGANAGGLGANVSTTFAGPVTLAKHSVFSPGFPIPGNSMTLTGVIDGPGTLASSNGGSVILANGANTFGGLDQQALGERGTVVVGADHAIPGTPTIDLAGGLKIDGHAQTLAGLTGQGTLDLGAPPSVLTLNGNGVTAFAGSVTGSGVIQHTGTGHQTFSGGAPGNFSGPIVIDHGIVTISGQMPGNVTVNNDGMLSLTSNGTAGTITVNDGHLQLNEGGAGIGNSKTLTLDAAATVDVGGTAPATLGSLKVTGTVTLGGATLSLQPPAGFAPPQGTSFTLIDNDGADPVIGTFAGLPEGSTVMIGTVNFKISYVGGTGNDVVLASQALPKSYLLSEGATSNFFTTEILLANPNNVAADISITFLKDDGTTVDQTDSLPAMSHKTIRVNDIAGMAATAFSTIVKSLAGLPLAVERTMTWDQTGYGAHTEHATDETATTWYFAEGSQGFFHTYLLLANPQTTANHATVQYLRETEAPLTRSYDLKASSRLTVDAAADDELVGRSFGMIVTFDQPGAAERAMYFGDVPLFNGGHESAGVTAPSTSWFLAEGATGPFFETFILLANPNDAAATVTMTYLPAAGEPITSVKTIAGHTRLTINLETESPQLANAAVSTQVASTQPILAERSQYWPDPAPNWYEAHNSFGVTSLGTKWAMAEGRVGGPSNAQTYILLANPGDTDAAVSITFLREGGATPLTKSFTVSARSRFNVPVGPGTSVPELTSENFGALVTSDRPIAVERAVYWDANNQIWAAGTDATATPIP